VDGAISYLRVVRRRDLVVSAEKKRSRRTFALLAVAVVVVALPLLWLALQTLGGKSSKGNAVVALSLRF
jgi:hypothetical protein